MHVEPLYFASTDYVSWGTYKCGNHVKTCVCVCVRVGMLLAGLLLRNVPYVTDAIFIDTHWSAALRNIALSIILTRAGLGLNPEVRVHLNISLS